MTLDIDFVRAQFPAFSVPALNGQAFFENAGGSYPCGRVVDRLTRFYRERKVQPYGPYEASRFGGEEMDEARARVAAMLGVETNEVSFGPSTTQNTYVLAQAFAEMLEPGDAIIVTDQDHEANTGPWRRLGRRGIDVREWKLEPETGHLPIDGLKRLLDGRVRLVCFPHASNIVAEINPVAEIARLAHDAGAVICVDGVSYAPHGFPDVGALGADIYLFSAYKTYGPHQGVMAVRRALAEKLPNQGHYFNGDVLYKRFTPAGPDHAQIAACAGLADYVDDLYAHHFGGRNENQSSALKARAPLPPPRGEVEIRAANFGWGAPLPPAQHSDADGLTPTQNRSAVLASPQGGGGPSSSLNSRISSLADRMTAGEKTETRAVHDLMRAHETALLQPLLEYLATKNSVRVLGPRDASARMPTVALHLREPGAEAAARLSAEGICCGGGDFYAVRCLEAQRIDPDHGVLRLSFVHYTAKAEIDRLIAALERAL